MVKAPSCVSVYAERVVLVLFIYYFSLCFLYIFCLTGYELISLGY